MWKPVVWPLFASAKTRVQLFHPISYYPPPHDSGDMFNQCVIYHIYATPSRQYHLRAKYENLVYVICLILPYWMLNQNIQLMRVESFLGIFVISRENHVKFEVKQFNLTTQVMAYSVFAICVVFGVFLITMPKVNKTENKTNEWNIYDHYRHEKPSYIEHQHKLRIMNSWKNIASVGGILPRWVVYFTVFCFLIFIYFGCINTIFIE